MNTDRLNGALPQAVGSLHALARDLELNNEELIATLGFLKEVAEADELVLLADVLGLSRLVDDLTHAGQDGTQSNVLGPFYRPDAPWIENPGSIAPPDEEGERLELWGRVSDGTSGAPLGGAVIEFWQADARGLYSNEDSERSPWALRGRQLIADDGSYQLETIKPKHYTVKHDGPVGRLLAALGRHPWRPAHIHFLVSAPGYRRLVTQVYVAGGPYLDDDAIGGVKDELVVPIEAGRLRFDLALSRG
ncbi:MAG TPA: dioxygenase [Candidatus Limnocylindria bacterium]|nr:dioxygenase [Candidatus Limnocylindria bacterium]